MNFPPNREVRIVRTKQQSCSKPAIRTYWCSLY